MNNWQIIVQERLIEWAEWFSSGNLLGLGYPTISTNYTIWKGTVRAKGLEKPLPSHPNAEKMEALVQQLAKIDAHLAFILRSHYFNFRSIRQQAKKMKISHSKYKHDLDQAHAWIGSQLFMKNF